VLKKNEKYFRSDLKKRKSRMSEPDGKKKGYLEQEKGVLWKIQMYCDF